MESISKQIARWILREELATLAAREKRVCELNKRLLAGSWAAEDREWNLHYAITHLRNALLHLAGQLHEPVKQPARAREAFEPRNQPEHEAYPSGLGCQLCERNLTDKPGSICAECLERLAKKRPARKAAPKPGTAVAGPSPRTRQA